MQELDDFGIAETWRVEDWLGEANFDEPFRSVGVPPPTWEDDGWSTAQLVAIAPHLMDCAADNNARIVGGEAELREQLAKRIEAMPL